MRKKNPHCEKCVYYKYYVGLGYGCHFAAEVGILRGCDVEDCIPKKKRLKSPYPSVAEIIIGEVDVKQKERSQWA